MQEIALSEGQIVGGDFEVLRPLGAGGMGAVYVARQLSTGAIRALKLMRSRFSADPAFVRRFTLEARASAQIRSRHVVEVVQAGVDASLSLPWLAMEFLEGRTLEEAMLEFGAPSAADAELLLDQLWHALGAAHDAHLVHRDLKPENLFLARGDSPGVPFTLKVLDFGIAKWLADGERKTTERLVTPLWGAPEQSVAGAPIGPHTDVWSLGLLVFWLFTGKSFWHGEGSHSELERAIHHDPIPDASARALELGCTRPLTPAFEAWFTRCVARDPKARFTHARQAGAALCEVPLAWATATRPWRGEHDPAPSGSAPTLRAAPSSRELARTPLDARAGASTSSPVDAGATAERARRRPLARLAALGTPLALASLGVAAYFARPALLAPSSRAPSAGGTASLLPVPPDMRWIPAGSLQLGALGPAGGAGSAERLTLAAFAIDRLEVSAGQYRACVDAAACTPSAFRSDGAGPALISSFDELCNFQHPERSDHPVNCVDRRQARAYCRWRGRRLPRDAEWEYAARGSDGRAYPWGKEPPKNCDMAVVSGLCARSPESTRRVGSRESNSLSPFGVADMSGNVWEWVEDDDAAQPGLGAGPSRELADGSAVGIMRGGGWDYPAERATSVARLAVPETRADVSAGFRCALSLELQGG